MDNPENSMTRPSRRTIIKASSGALAGSVGLVASQPAAAHERSVHKEMGWYVADNICDELNNSICDYKNTIKDYSEDPDNDPYYCGDENPDEVCDFLDTVDQSIDHYVNPQHDYGVQGRAHIEAADEAEAAKSRIDSNDYVEAAIKTGRSLHFIQDAGTLVHTGRESEQAYDRSIHTEFEDWVDNKWLYFEDNAETESISDINSRDDIQEAVKDLADSTHDALQKKWWDIKDGKSYARTTRHAQEDQIESAQECSNGTVHWIWENA